MNCRDIESLLLAEGDGVLTPEQHAALAGHVATCPACRQMRTDLREAALFLKTDTASVPVPDIETEWRTLRARLNGAAAKPAKKRPLAPVIWFSASLAAAAALAIAFLANKPEAATPLAAPVPAIANTTVIEPVEVNADTMVYVDKDSGWLVVWATDAGTTSRG